MATVDIEKFGLISPDGYWSYFIRCKPDIFVSVNIRPYERILSLSATDDSITERPLRQPYLRFFSDPIQADQAAYSVATQIAEDIALERSSQVLNLVDNIKIPTGLENTCFGEQQLLLRTRKYAR